MSKITIQKDSTLLVPDVPTVPYITGDGVGAEVTPSMQIIVDAAVRKAYGVNVILNGWKCWLENVLSMKQVRGFRKKRCRHFRNIW